MRRAGGSGICDRHVRAAHREDTQMHRYSSSMFRTLFTALLCASGAADAQTGPPTVPGPPPATVPTPTVPGPPPATVPTPTVPGPPPATVPSPSVPGPPPTTVPPSNVP